MLRECFLFERIKYASEIAMTESILTVFSLICACEVSTDSDGMHPGTRIAALVTEPENCHSDERILLGNQPFREFTSRLGCRTAQF